MKSVWSTTLRGTSERGMSAGLIKVELTHRSNEDDFCARTQVLNMNRDWMSQ